MKYGELIDQSIECIKTFNPVYSTVDSHADTFLQTVSLTCPTRCISNSASCHFCRLRIPTRRSSLSKCFTGAYVTKSS